MITEQEILELRASKRRKAIATYAVLSIIAFAIGFVTGLGVARKVNPCVVVPTISIQRDTVTVRDTVQGKIVPPVIRSIIRRDTLILPSKSDTSFKQGDTSKREANTGPQPHELPDGSISVPIEQKVYATPLYRAVVSGWHPALDSITVYPERKIITETITKLAPPLRRWWTIAAGPSATYTIDRQFVPGVSVVLGLNIKSW